MPLPSPWAIASGQAAYTRATRWPSPGWATALLRSTLRVFDEELCDHRAAHRRAA